MKFKNVVISNRIDPEMNRFSALDGILTTSQLETISKVCKGGNEPTIKDIWNLINIQYMVCYLVDNFNKFIGYKEASKYKIYIELFRIIYFGLLVYFNVYAPKNSNKFSQYGIKDSCVKLIIWISSAIQVIINVKKGVYQVVCMSLNNK